MESQFGQHVLDRILREILLANINHGHVSYLNKTDLSDGFLVLAWFRMISLKLGVVFPIRHDQ